MGKNKSIGGYLGLELSIGKDFYPKAIKVNTGRNGLEYILRANNYSKIYIPYYTCDAIMRPIKNIGMDYEFYKINHQLEPVFNFKKMNSAEGFLYTNYLGLKSHYIKNDLPKKENIIIDNAQAFFSTPLKNYNTFYSPRKFFGVPDGGYVFSTHEISFDLETSISHGRIEHLAKQADVSIEAGYDDYLNNETYLNSVPLQKMSSLTEKLLQSIDYKWVSKRRIENFRFLKKELDRYNRLNLPDNDEAPLHYPLLLGFDCEMLRKELIENKIYNPKYWENVLEWMPNKALFETELVTQMIHLPIDQRYEIAEMKYLVKIVKEIVRKYE